MPILNTGQDAFDNDLAALGETLQQQRATQLGTVIDAQLGLRRLLAAEAARLEAKRSGDPRAQLLRERLDTVTGHLAALAVERDIAGLRVPPVARTGALIQGRVTDADQRAAGRVTVHLVDEKGADLPGVAPVEADDAGYYAFVLSPEALARLGADAKATVVLQSGDAKLAPTDAKPFTIAAGVATMQEMALDRGELERLRLRVPVATGPTSPPPAPPPSPPPTSPPSPATPQAPTQDTSRPPPVRPPRGKGPQ